MTVDVPLTLQTRDKLVLLKSKGGSALVSISIKKKAFCIKALGGFKKDRAYLR